MDVASQALGAYAGQGTGLATRVQPAAEIVREVCEEAVQALSSVTYSGA